MNICEHNSPEHKINIFRSQVQKISLLHLRNATLPVAVSDHDVIETDHHRTFNCLAQSTLWIEMPILSFSIGDREKSRLSGLIRSLYGKLVFFLRSDFPFTKDFKLSVDPFLRQVEFPVELWIFSI